MCFFEKPAEATWPWWYYMSRLVSKVTLDVDVVVLPERCGELARAWALWPFHSSMLYHLVLAFPVAQRQLFGQGSSSRCCFRSGPGSVDDFGRRLAGVSRNCCTAAWNHLGHRFHRSRQPAGHLDGIESRSVAVAVRADLGIRYSGPLERIGSHSAAVVRAVPGSRFFVPQTGIPLGRIRFGPLSHIESHLADSVDHIERTVFAGHTLGILGTVAVGHSFLVGRRTVADRRIETCCFRVKFSFLKNV